MDEIRIFNEDHVSDAASLYLKAGRGQFRPAPQALEDAFRESFLTNPWVSPEMPSLVYMEKGKLVGFAGVIPRPMEFRGRPIRAATIPMWLVDHQLHRGLAGMKLLRQVLNGPQEFSFNDGVGNEASSVYEALRARVSPVYSFIWLRVLRPFQTARDMLGRARGVFPVLKGISGLVAAPMDFLVSKAPIAMFRPEKSSFSSSPASPAELLECIQEARGREALRSAYSMPSFSWLMSQAGKGAGHRGLRMMVVRSRDGVRCGWFVYYADPGQAAYVLAIGSHRKSQFKEVLLALFEDAWEQGSAAVKGQAIPHFLTTLTEQHCLFRQPFSRVIGHSRDSEIMQAFLTADTALSGLDGTGWLRFSREPWT